MGRRKKAQNRNTIRVKQNKSVAERENNTSSEAARKKKLEIVLKCDTSGCAQAIITSITALNTPEIEIDIISSGVGSVSKTDIFMAESGSRLILGFNVGIMPHVEQLAAEHIVEIRLYDVIYRLLEDLEKICGSFVPEELAEEILGTAKVIALFKSSRRGIILGCEVITGKLALGKTFRVLGAMGPIYVGTIESLHIEKDAVKEARKGQQVGLKIRDFNKAKIGDLVESFRLPAGRPAKPWQPHGKIYYP